MPQIALVSPARHAQRRWQRPVDYRFAAQDALVTLSAQEMPLAATALPLGFLRTSESTWEAVAVLGVQPGQNLFVTAQGQWIGRYVPLRLRCYPFLMADKEGRNVLCVDEDSGLVTTGTDGERFFTDDRQPAPLVAEVLANLARCEHNTLATRNACAQLAAMGCLQPWLVGSSQAADRPEIGNLYQVNEAVLNALPDTDFLALRKSGALAVAYCQMLSMPLLPRILALTNERDRGNTTPAQHTPASLAGLSTDGTLNFSGLGA